MALRVAHVISGLGIGGAERQVANLLNAMPVEYRSIISVGRPRSGSTFYADLDPAINQVFIRVRRRNLPVGIVKLASELRRSRINVVHTHMYEANLFGTLAARLAGVPVVVTSEHGENPWKGPFQRWVERRVISPLAGIRFCVSPRILELRRDRDGVPPAKLRLIVNGTIMPIVGDNRTRNPVPVVGTVGRFIPAKGYPGLLQATAQLLADGYKLRLCIVGDGPEAEKLRDMVSELALEAIVEFPGMVRNIGEFYRRFDVYVSSSVREGLPMVLLEAMAHGLPVVATDVGACAEVVRNGECGFVIRPGEPSLLAHALGRLLDDAELRETFGRNACKRIEQNYSISVVADMHVSVYRELLHRSGLD